MAAVANGPNGRAPDTESGVPNEADGGRPRFTSRDDAGRTGGDAPARSPDILAAPSTRGRGVRRLNRRPLIVVFAVVGAVLLAFLYTVQQRVTFRRRMAQQSPPAAEAGTTPVPSQPPVLANAPAGGVIPAVGDAGSDSVAVGAGGEVALGGESGAAPSAGFDPNYGSSAGQGTGATGLPGTVGFGGDAQRRVRVGFGPTVDPVFGGDTAARTQAWRAYREELNEIRHARLQAESQALAAAPTVEFKGRGGSATAEGVGMPGGAASGSSAVQALAQDPELRAMLALAQADGRGGPATSSVYGTGPRATAPGGDDAADGTVGGAGGRAGAAPSALAAGRGGAGQGGAPGLASTGAARGRSRVDERSPYTLTAGTVIPAVLVAGMNSDLPGQVLAQVSENVYDGATGARVLVPQGAKLLGTYNASITTGQQRVFAIWNRVLYPDGSTLDLGDMPGADQTGAAGFRDRVDNHYGQTFGNAILLSLFGAGVQLSQPRQSSVFAAPTNGQIVGGALGQQLGALGMETARRGLQVPPRLQVRAGYRFNVMVTRDLPLRAWGQP